MTQPWAPDDDDVGNLDLSQGVESVPRGSISDGRLSVSEIPTTPLGPLASKDHLDSATDRLSRRVEDRHPSQITSNYLPTPSPWSWTLGTSTPTTNDHDSRLQERSFSNPASQGGASARTPSLSFGMGTSDTEQMTYSGPTTLPVEPDTPIMVVADHRFPESGYRHGRQRESSRSESTSNTSTVSTERTRPQLPSSPASSLPHSNSGTGDLSPIKTFPPSSVPPLLHTATRSRNRSVMATLLRHGACSVDERDGQGRTALHVAAELGDEALVLLLLHHGADAQLCDDLGQNALYHAVLAGNNDVLEVLLEDKNRRGGGA